MFTHDPMGAGAWRPDVVNFRWRRARRVAGSSTTVRLHDLRHWHATELLDAGVPVPTVAAWLGHIDGTTTMKIYATEPSGPTSTPRSLLETRFVDLTRRRKRAGSRRRPLRPVR